ncbi:PAAR domain-containing protein [Neorhodopirellula lusitana]|uniref:PAAR domain-containing protein n=1 Tax=Neorhodopirellula lusitana TaxID=445327 RepID=UPI0038510E27
MPPAARITDEHSCSEVTGVVPHVGGPIIGPGEPTVLIASLPAAILGDEADCTGPPDTLAMGSATVMIGGKPAVRLGDETAHGGSVTTGEPTVLIGG